MTCPLREDGVYNSLEVGLNRPAQTTRVPFEHTHRGGLIIIDDHLITIIW